MTTKNQKKNEYITARCGSHVKEYLHVLSKSSDTSMSDVLTKSVEEYYERHYPGKGLHQRESRLFGRYGSKRGDLSVNRKKYLKEKIREKHSHS